MKTLVSIPNIINLHPRAFHFIYLFINIIPILLKPHFVELCYLIQTKKLLFARASNKWWRGITTQHLLIQSALRYVLASFVGPVIDNLHPVKTTNLRYPVLSWYNMLLLIYVHMWYGLSSICNQREKVAMCRGRYYRMSIELCICHIYERILKLPLFNISI